MSRAPCSTTVMESSEPVLSQCYVCAPVQEKKKEEVARLYEEQDQITQQ